MNRTAHAKPWLVAAALLLAAASASAGEKSVFDSLGKLHPKAKSILRGMLASAETLMDDLDKIMEKDTTSRSTTESAWETATDAHWKSWNAQYAKAHEIVTGAKSKDSLPGVWPGGYSTWGNIQVKFLSEVVDKKKGHLMIRFKRQTYELSKDLKDRLDTDAEKQGMNIRPEMSDMAKELKVLKNLLPTLKTSREVGLARVQRLNKVWNTVYKNQQYLKKRREWLKEYYADKRNLPATYQMYLTQLKKWHDDVIKREWLEPRFKTSVKAWYKECDRQFRTFKTRHEVCSNTIDKNILKCELLSDNSTFKGLDWDKLTGPVDDVLADYVARQRELQAQEK